MCACFFYCTNKVVGVVVPVSLVCVVWRGGVESSAWCLVCVACASGVVQEAHSRVATSQLNQRRQRQIFFLLRVVVGRDDRDCACR